MTEEEKEILMMLNDVYDKYSALSVQHHADMDEFVNALHVIQHLVMIRSVRRRYPDMFPLNLKDSVEGFNINRAIEETLMNAFKDEKDLRNEEERHQ